MAVFSPPTNNSKASLVRPRIGFPSELVTYTGTSTTSTVTLSRTCASDGVAVNRMSSSARFMPGARLPLPRPALATRFADQLQRFDDDSLLRALAHVVDGQRGDRTGGHGLHLHAGLAFAADDGSHLDRPSALIDVEGDVDGGDADVVGE